MSLNYFENDLLKFLMNVVAQDEFRSWRFENLLMDKIRDIDCNQLGDVIQILYICIDQLVKARNLKHKYQLGTHFDSRCRFL